MSVIQLFIDGVDVWGITRLGASFTHKAQNGNPGSCSFVIRDEFANLTYKVGADLKLRVDGTDVWAGYVVSVSYQYPASVFPTTNAYAIEHGVDRMIGIEGVDLNYLFTKRFLVKKGDESEPYGPKYDPEVSDKKVVKDLFPDWIDLTGDNIDTNSRIDKVGTIGLFEKSQPFRTASSWGDVMKSISRVSGAVYYLSPSRELVYTDVDTISSPLTLTDVPSLETDVGYRDFELLEDASNMVNDFLLWSSALGKKKIRYTRSQSNDSIRDHNLWQSGQLISDLYHREYLDMRARTTVYGSPQNKRGAKDDRISIKATVFDVPIIAGEKYRVICNAFAYDDVLPAREVTMTFPTPTNVQYDLLLSHEIDDPWSYFETYYPPVPEDNPDLGDVPSVISPPQIVRVLDSFTRELIPVQDYAGPTFNPGWQSGELLQWQTPEHPSNAYYVDGNNGVVASISAFYQLEDEPPYNEVYAPYPDAEPDLRNILVAFRLGRWKRLYQTSNEKAYDPDGQTSGMTGPLLAFDVSDSERHTPNIDTFAVISQSSPQEGFRAEPIVPDGGEVLSTVIIGSAPYVVDSSGACYPEGGWGGYISGMQANPAYTNKKTLSGGTSAQVYKAFKRTPLPTIPVTYQYGPEIEELAPIRFIPIGTSDTQVIITFPPTTGNIGITQYTDASIIVEVSEATYVGGVTTITSPPVAAGTIGSLSGGVVVIDRTPGASGFAITLRASWEPTGGGVSGDGVAITRSPNGTFQQGSAFLPTSNILYTSYLPVSGSGDLAWSDNLTSGTDPASMTNMVFPLAGSAFYAGRNTGAGLVPAYIRRMGVATAEGVATVEMPTASDFDMRLNAYMFVGKDMPGMSYPWDMNFWFQTMGHRLTFTRNSQPTNMSASFSGIAQATTIATGVSDVEFTFGVDEFCMNPIVDASDVSTSSLITGMSKGSRPAFWVSWVDESGLNKVYLSDTAQWKTQYRPDTGAWRLGFSRSFASDPTALYLDLPGPEVLVDVYLGEPDKTDIYPMYTYPNVYPIYPIPDENEETGGYTVLWNATGGYTDASVNSVLKLDPDTDYWLRIVQDDNNAMHARVWINGQPEPSTWQFTKKPVGSPVGFGGYSDSGPVSAGPTGISVGTSVFPFQSYTVEVAMIATGVNNQGDDTPSTAVEVYEAVTPVWSTATDKVYEFRTSKPYQAGTLNRVRVFGQEQQKGTNFTELNPDHGTIRIVAGVPISAFSYNSADVVSAGYYTVPVDVTTSRNNGGVVIR